jgi:cell wall-associated NlpC family hydrolase
VTLTGARLALLILIALTGAACATTGATPRPFPGAPAPPAARKAPAPEPPPIVVPETPPRPDDLISTALMLRGVPYRNGGSDPSGFDCSGFVQWVFAQNGVRLPREVSTQYGVGTNVDLDEVQPGDLLFFETVSRGASHVGLAIGGDQFVHAPSSTGVVRVERFSSSYWNPRFVGARRVTTEATKTD